MKYVKDHLKKCIDQNIYLYNKKLVINNFGNVSIRIDDNHIAIKPSGIVPIDIKIRDVPIIRISDSKQMQGSKKPSVDTPTHIEIYKVSKSIHSIVHTHSTYATSWAQTGKSIPVFGTTHADYWLNEIPNVEFLNKDKVKENYEKNTGLLISRFLKKLNSPFFCPGVILSGHGVFTWGKDHKEALDVAEVLEFIAKTAFITKQLGISKKIPKHIVKKHFFRKHGLKAYYGQTDSK